jgi:hypothetical protein
MSRELYKQLVDTKPWDRVDEVFASTPNVAIPLHTKLAINPSDWVQFSIDNLPLSKQEWSNPKPYHTGPANDVALINNELGRNEGNTANINYGTEGDTNAKMLEILGKNNILSLNLDQTTVLIRLLIKMPGHGFPWHFDDAGTYTKTFPELNIKDDKTCSIGKVVRYWFPVADWQVGHVLQVSDTIIHHWNAGDTYIIPWGQGHASSNFGYKPMYTVSLTGVVLD